MLHTINIVCSTRYVSLYSRHKEKYAKLLVIYAEIGEMDLFLALILTTFRLGPYEQIELSTIFLRRNAKVDTRHLAKTFKS